MTNDRRGEPFTNNARTALVDVVVAIRYSCGVWPISTLEHRRRADIISLRCCPSESTEATSDRRSFAVSHFGDPSHRAAGSVGWNLFGGEKPGIGNLGGRHECVLFELVAPGRR